jgi:hypothetical protein
MPLLATWIGSLVTSLAGFFATWMTKRVALLLAAMTFIVSTTGTFVAAMQGFASGVSLVAPAELGYALSWFVPGNITLCLSAYYAARVCRWAYDWNIKVIQYKLL